MKAKLIDGKAIAKDVRLRWKSRVDELKQRGFTPGLAVIIVGDDPASKVYVRNKIKACEEVGLYSESYRLSADISEQALLQQIQELNGNTDIHGILVQLPLPNHINENKVIETISADKDVDGFHLYNVGALVTGNTIFPPCTPYGVQCLLENIGVPVEGRHAVVVGRSNIVGKPMAMLLLHMNATVSICTSKTRNLSQITNQADILVVATGQPQMITGDMVKKGAVVIDVGINRLDDGRLVGDVDFDTVCEKAGFITPVPGGVGPMTITMLVVNTVRSAERAETKSIKVAQLLEDKKTSPFTINARNRMTAVTVFTFDGQDFIRFQTTLLTPDGKSAVNTKLDRNYPSYLALMQKRSYIGEAIIFGRDYETYYAPLSDEQGQLTGAIFVGNQK